MSNVAWDTGHGEAASPGNGRISSALLWLFVIFHGIAFGAGIYESRVVIPFWADVPPRQWPNTGTLFWVYVTTVPLTLLTIANGVAAWRDRSPRRPWWLASVAITVIERAATFCYFIPTMVGLQGSESMPQDEVRLALSQWVLLNHGRHVLSLAAWLAALAALGQRRVSIAS